MIDRTCRWCMWVSNIHRHPNRMLSYWDTSRWLITPCTLFMWASNIHRQHRPWSPYLFNKQTAGWNILELHFFSPPRRRKMAICSSCSTHCRYQIKIPKTLFNSNRGHIAIQKWSHIFILTSFRQIGTVHWPRRLQPFFTRTFKSTCSQNTRLFYVIIN